MGVFKELFDIVTGREQQVVPIDLNTLHIKMRGHHYYKLCMIAEELNARLNSEYEITPEKLARRVLVKFLDQAYRDSTETLVRNLLPDYIDRSP